MCYLLSLSLTLQQSLLISEVSGIGNADKEMIDKTVTNQAELEGDPTFPSDWLCGSVVDSHLKSQKKNQVFQPFGYDQVEKKRKSRVY